MSNQKLDSVCVARQQDSVIATPPNHKLCNVNTRMEPHIHTYALQHLLITTGIWVGLTQMTSYVVLSCPAEIYLLVSL